MATELDKVSVITDLSDKAIQEYEGLQKKHESATMECKRLEEERDEAIKKLSEFQQVSQMVIVEVNAIQEDLEIERTCRENAEALATELNLQNRSLKRKSMMLLSHLSPETIAEINLADDEEEDEESGKVCLSPQCQTTISDLQNKLGVIVKEKNQAVQDLQMVRDELKQTRDELLKEKHDNTVLIAETLQQKKLLGQYNRVSSFAVEEFEALQDTLSLERDLRTEAEKFARAMMVEQKQLKRQSQLLMQSSSPSQALQDALGQITTLTQELESKKLEHQDQMKQMEEQLKSSEAQKELTALRRKLELLEEEKTDYHDKCSKAEVEVRDLRFTVEELQKKLQAATNPHPAPAPPPPPPPPPPPAPSASNPLSSLLSILRKRRNVSTDIPLEVKDSTKTPGVDVRQQAVEEMMQRIKKGVRLRPVNHSNIGPARQMERPPSNSAYQELKGIMESLSRTSPKPKTVSPPTDGQDDELQKILLKRRGRLDF